MANTPPRIVSELAGPLPTAPVPTLTQAASALAGASLPSDYWKLVLASNAVTGRQGHKLQLLLRVLERYGSSIAEYSLLFHAVAKERLLDQTVITRAASLAGPLLSRISELFSLSREVATPADGRNATLRLIAALGLHIGPNRVVQNLQPQLNELFAASLTAASDYKTMLQEYGQERGMRPCYELVSVTGPPHETTRISKATIGSHESKGAPARSKRAAEQSAAAALLDRLGVAIRINVPLQRFRPVAHECTEPQLKAARSAETLLGYSFRNKGLLAAALTHPSYKPAQPTYSYAPLARLGASAIPVVALEILLRRRLEWLELNEASVAAANRWVHLRIPTSADELSSFPSSRQLSQLIVFSGLPPSSPTVLADVFQSVLAAVLADRSVDAPWETFETDAQFIIQDLQTSIDTPRDVEAIDPKTRLQEILQSLGALPRYSIRRADGPPHAKRFTSVVSVPLGARGYEFQGIPATARGQSEQSAAKQALKCFAPFREPSEATLRLLQSNPALSRFGAGILRSLAGIVAKAPIGGLSRAYRSDLFGLRAVASGDVEAIRLFGTIAEKLECAEELAILLKAVDNAPRTGSSLVRSFSAAIIRWEESLRATQPESLSEGSLSILVREIQLYLAAVNAETHAPEDTLESIADMVEILRRIGYRASSSVRGEPKWIPRRVIDLIAICIGHGEPSIELTSRSDPKEDVLLVNWMDGPGPEEPVGQVLSILGKGIVAGSRALEFSIPRAVENDDWTEQTIRRLRNVRSFEREPLQNAAQLAHDAKNMITAATAEAKAATLGRSKRLSHLAKAEVAIETAVNLLRAPDHGEH